MRDSGEGAVLDALASVAASGFFLREKRKFPALEILTEKENENE